MIKLIPTTLEHLDAEDLSVHDLCRILDLKQPLEWPPEHNDAATRNWFRNRLIEAPHEAHWGSYYVCDNENLIGLAGYHGPPDDSGGIEIGYSVIPSQQRQGYASQAVDKLCDMAFNDPRVSYIKAETLPHLLPSQAVLIKCGFVKTSQRIDEEEGVIWGYRRNRS